MLIKHRLAALGAFMALGGLALAAEARTFDEFSDANSPKHFVLRAAPLTLTIKGELEVELHDLQGAGGVGHDSPTDTRTIGTRSPFVELDSFWLALRLGLWPGAAVNSVLEFSASGARVGAAWFDAHTSWPQTLEHHFELGLNTPLIKIDRRTERYPLTGTIYWREPELHASYEGVWQLGARTILELGLVVAMMRPLAFVPVQESSSFRGTINLLAYGAARPYSGNAPLFGAKLHAATHGFYATLFGFVGRLAAEAGTDELRTNFINFQDLPGYNTEATLHQDRRFYWGGARIGFDARGFHGVLEGIGSRESLLRRYGVYGQLSYELRLRAFEKLLHTVEALIRYEVYRLLDTSVVLPSGRALRSPAPSDALTWDLEMATVALIATLYRDVLRLRLEYYWIGEENGVPALGIASTPFPNNELLVQLELRF